MNLCCHKEDLEFLRNKTHVMELGEQSREWWQKRPYNDHILTPKNMFNYCKEHIKNITFLYVEAQVIASNAEDLQQSFSETQTIKGTRQMHRFFHTADGMLLLYKTSQQTEEPEEILYVGSKAKAVVTETSPPSPQVNKFVACVYDEAWYIGIINEVYEEFEDYHVKFMISLAYSS